MSKNREKTGRSTVAEINEEYPLFSRQITNLEDAPG